MKVKENYWTKEPIEEYWQKVFIQSDIIGPHITPKDEPLLRHLKKV